MLPTSIKGELHLTNTLTTYKNSVLAYAFGFATLIGFSVLSTIMQQNGVPTQQGVNFWLINGAYSLCLGVVALLILMLSKQPVKQTLGLDKKAFGVDKAVLLCATVFVMINVTVVLNSWFVQFLTTLGCNVKSYAVSTEQILQNPLLAVVVGCILPAINEELLFRGLIVKGLNSKMGNAAAVVVSGLLFALFHANPAQTLHQFALGCLLALVAISTQSVVLPVIAHLFNNLAVLALALYVEPTGVYTQYSYWIVAVGAVVLAGLIWLVVRQFKTNKIVVEKQNTSAYDLLLVATAAFGVYLWAGAL